MAKKTNTRSKNNRENVDIEKLKSGAKQPPSAVEVEASVLGAMLIENDAVPKAIEVLKPDAFYEKKNRVIFESMMSLYEADEPIDTVSVYEELRKSGKADEAGGAAYISKLTQDISSAANIDYHARVVLEKWILRQLISASFDIAHNAYEGSEDVFDLLDNAETKIFQISEEGIKESFKSMDKAVKEALELIEAIHSKNISTFSVPSGFFELDELLGGFQKSDLIIIAARPSMGKCLGKGTRVLMYNGTLKAVEDVCVGDLLMGDDSTPRKVLSLTHGKEMMYWVRQLHGIDYRVNESHILSLKRSRNEGSHTKGDVINIEIRDYLEQSPKWKTNYKGYKTSVEFNYQDVPIDPYLLGLWLGDGKSDSSRIFTQDQEVVEYLEEYAEANEQFVSVYQEKDKCPAYTISGGRSQKARDNSFQAKLRELGVLNNKHIPQIYLANNRRIRSQLLAGLIDSDGYVNSEYGGTIEITSKYEHLARQIKFLCDTLGYRTSLKSKKATISSIGFECIVWRVRFNGNIDEIPTRVKRKQGKEWTDYRDWKVTGIKVEPDKVDDYYGFEIDGNHLFLLEDCTVTHNTAFAMSAARNAAIDHNIPIGIFSLEMSTIQLATRLISAEARINAHNVRTGKFKAEEGAKISRTVHKLSKAPIFIDDTPGISILELRAKARRLKNEKGIGMIIVDYLQLVNPSSSMESREREISSISRSLKALAKELNIPVIALSQLNRAVESRSDKKPMLSDLRESGSIEQDADVVLFLYRPEMYGITSFGTGDMQGETTEGVAEVIVGKQRNGPTGEARLRFLKDYARFENLERFRTQLPAGEEPVAALEEPPF
ncbi:MAG: replicative DNA helicase [Bacteroidota bacterium]